MIMWILEHFTIEVKEDVRNRVFANDQIVTYRFTAIIWTLLQSRRLSQLFYSRSKSSTIITRISLTLKKDSYQHITIMIQLQIDQSERMTTCNTLTSCDDWSTNRVSFEIVTTHFFSTLSFENKKRSFDETIEFVMNSTLDFILTNRHVIEKKSMFIRAEFEKSVVECLIIFCYVDLIHDFVFCKYDVTHLKDIHVTKIEFRLDLVEMNLEIRVLDNDQSQKLFILFDTVSKLNCNSIHWNACECF